MEPTPILSAIVVKSSLSSAKGGNRTAHDFTTENWFYIHNDPFCATAERAQPLLVS